MRGDDREQAGMWSYISPEQRVPADHPLRPSRVMVDAILTDLSPEFATLYSPVGRPAIPPRNCCGCCFCRSSTARAASGCGRLPISR